MELTTVSNNIDNQIISEHEITTSIGNFIEANTKQVTLSHLKRECIIPVYSDNETSIAHSQFIEATKEVVQDNFAETKILEPNIRASHVIRGRLPSAIRKSVNELRPEEKTIYYQRCAFMIEVPSLTENVNNNTMSLTIGGVRALNQENLYSRRNLEKFKVFIGFKNLRQSPNIDSLEMASLDPNDINSFDRKIALKDAKGTDKADLISDYGMNFSLALPLFLFIDKEIRKDYGVNAIESIKMYSPLEITNKWNGLIESVIK